MIAGVLKAVAFPYAVGVGDLVAGRVPEGPGFVAEVPPVLEDGPADLLGAGGRGPVDGVPTVLEGVPFADPVWVGDLVAGRKS